VEETRVPRENQRPATSHRQTLSLNVVSSTPFCKAQKYLIENEEKLKADLFIMQHATV